MLSSITGQNDWWSQSGVSALSPVSAIGQGGSQGGMQSPAGQTNAATSGSTNGTSVSGSAPSPLAPDMSFALMMFQGSQSTSGIPGGGDAEQTAASTGQSQGVGLSGSVGPSGPVNGAPATGSQDPTSATSKMFSDLQSLFSMMFGSAGVASNATTDPAGTAASGASADNTSVTGTGAAGTSLTGTGASGTSSLQSDLQTLASDMNALASGLGGSATASTGGTPAPFQGGDGSNGTTGRQQNGYSDHYQAQFALSVYSASSLAEPASSSGSSLGISV